MKKILTGTIVAAQLFAAGAAEKRKQKTGSDNTSMAIRQ